MDVGAGPVGREGGGPPGSPTRLGPASSICSELRSRLRHSGALRGPQEPANWRSRVIIINTFALLSEFWTRVKSEPVPCLAWSRSVLQEADFGEGGRGAASWRPQPDGHGTFHTVLTRQSWEGRRELQHGQPRPSLLPKSPA